MIRIAIRVIQVVKPKRFVPAGSTGSSLDFSDPRNSGLHGFFF